MNKKVVAVLFGGRSTEHDVSKESAATIISHMSDDKYLVVPIYITKDGQWLLYDGPLESIKTAPLEKFGSRAVISPDTEHRGLLRIVNGKVKNIPIDVAIPVLHGSNGEDGTVQGLLELAGIPYVGCGVLASALCMDKTHTKQVAKSLNIQQTPYLWFDRSDLEDMADVIKKIRYKLKYPVFVKPANSGSSVGISKATNKAELEAALLLAAKLDRKILVEKAVVGRELECAVLGSYKDAEASVVGEILSATDFYDFDSKYNNPESKTTYPADIPEEVSEAIRSQAVDIFKATDCYGLARVDFFLAENNEIIFNEINTMPGFTSISMYPMLWRYMGVEVDALIDRLVELALKRI